MSQVLITGANRGIGLALHGAFAARGDRVIGTHRAAAAPGWVQLDVTRPDDHRAMAAAVDGPLDILVCNAGVFPDRGEAVDDGYPAQMWADGFAANVTGVFLSIQALLPKMGRGGRIAIISSQMASHTRAPGGNYIYRASKAAVLNLGRNLAADLAPRGIAVGIYHPGWVQTDMGGETADITVAQSAAGLVARIDALGPETTGCFETWDGRAHPY